MTRAVDAGRRHLPWTIRVVLCLLLAVIAVGFLPAAPAGGPAERGISQPDPCRAMTAPVYAYTNPATGAMLLTVSDRYPPVTPGGRTTTYLGAPFTVSTRARPGLVAVRSLTDPHNGDHLYSTHRRQIESALRDGYRLVGEPMYAASAPASCLRPVHRFVRDGRNRYALAEAGDGLPAPSGWRDVGVAFYAPALDRFLWPAAGGTGPLDRTPYLSTDSNAWSAYRAARTATDRALLYQVAATPTATWLGPSNTVGDQVRRIMDQARARGRTPQLVLYAIPHRDCGSFSAGGLADGAGYRHWIDQVKDAVGSGPAIVIVEPDAIGMACLPAAQQAERIALLHYAITAFSDAPDVWTYLHAGSAGIDVDAVAELLVRIDVSAARGLALNVSGFDATPSELAYGRRLLDALRSRGITGKHLVVDTSRNGLGRAPAGTTKGAPGWCNPPGRALGLRPTSRTGHAMVDAFLWIKPPGESDGACHPGDPTGWFNSYALELARNGLKRGALLPMPVP